MLSCFRFLFFFSSFRLQFRSSPLVYVVYFLFNSEYDINLPGMYEVGIVIVALRAAQLENKGRIFLLFGEFYVIQSEGTNLLVVLSCLSVYQSSHTFKITLRL